jgi:plastocyanin
VGRTARAAPPGLFAVGLVAGLLATGCSDPDPELVPDDRLRAELGLTGDDRVHTITVEAGTAEEATPDSLEVLVGDLVQFVSGDWMVHEVRFETDALRAPTRTFLEGSGQLASPPLLQRDARFVLTFDEAPPGRYPYRLTGNRAEGAGVIVVKAPGGG